MVLLVADNKIVYVCVVGDTLCLSFIVVDIFGDNQAVRMSMNQLKVAAFITDHKLTKSKNLCLRRTLMQSVVDERNVCQIIHS